jgi:hypothetical protein
MLSIAITININIKYKLYLMHHSIPQYLPSLEQNPLLKRGHPPRHSQPPVHKARLIKGLPPLLHANQNPSQRLQHLNAHPKNSAPACRNEPIAVPVQQSEHLLQFGLAQVVDYQGGNGVGLELGDWARGRGAGQQGVQVAGDGGVGVRVRGGVGLGGEEGLACLFVQLLGLLFLGEQLLQLGFVSFCEVLGTLVEGHAHSAGQHSRPGAENWADILLFLGFAG